MRVDAYNAVTSLYQQAKVKKQGKSVAANKSDKLEISRVGKDYQIAKKAVKEAPDIREDKVNELKAAIDNGTYEVSANDFAEVLLDKYFGSI